MMSNETINMSRELAELCFRNLNGGDNQLTGMEHAKAFRELRALLAQPAEQAALEAHPTERRCRRYGKDNPHWPCPVHSAAAEQHQGELVYMVRTHGSCCWEEVGDGSLEDFQSMPEEYELRALYTRPAEQPALVAVVLPERRCQDHFSEKLRDNADGWNACLDEVARLNPPQQ